MFIFDLSLRVALCNIIFHSVGSVQARHLQCDTWNSPIANLGAAMNGFDPMIADPFTLPNPGYKQMIFNPLKREADGIQSLNGFIGKFEETVYCNSDLESTSIKNYSDYKTLRQSDSPFEQEMWDSNFEVLFGSGRNETTQEKEIRNLLTESGGEIIEVSQKCVTHSVAISSFVKPVFTDAFKEAMKSIHISAMDPNSRSSNETFVRFIREFGTHYMKTTMLGSKIYFQKMFAHASRTTKEERNRKKCIEDSVRASLSVPVKIFELAPSFIKYSTACTDSSDKQTLSLASIYSIETVTSIGALPTEGVELWATKTKESPVPISFTLDKISHLIKPEWVNDISVSDENVTMGYLNATQISDFLEYKIVGYCHVMFGTNCLDHKIGCGYTRMCPAGEDCINDSSTELGYRCTPSKTGCGYDACPTGNYCINDTLIMEGYRCIEGKTVVVGGKITGGIYRTPKVDLIYDGKITPLPDLPRATDLNTVVVHSNKLYSCGGFGNSEACYFIDLAAPSPSWVSIFTLNRSYISKPMMTVGDNLWMITETKVKIIPFNGSTPTEHNLTPGMSVSGFSCGGGDESRRFVLPSYTNELWVNTDAQNPHMWRIYTSIGTRGYHRACMLLGTDIFVTGGAHNSVLSDTFRIDLVTNTCHQLPSLLYARRGHAMGLLDNKIAVFGGKNGTDMDTIEVLDVALNKWILSPLKLSAASVSFMGYATF